MNARRTDKWTLTQRCLPAFCACLLLLAAASKAAETADCAPQGELQFICGVELAEDSVLLPGSGLLLASGLNAGGSGTLKVVDTDSGQVRRFFPDGITYRHDVQRYPQCPGPPDLATFTAHGLALQQTGATQFLLLAAHEGGRKSVEAFSLQLADGALAATWVGCVVLPDDSNPNAVAALADGGMAIASMDDGATDRMARHVRGEAMGRLFEWQPGQGLKEYGGLQSQGGNGLEVSADGRWLYVSTWSGAGLLKVDRRGIEPASRIALDFLPDNLKWSRDGRLVIAGQRGPVARIADCNGAQCPADWVVALLDTASGQLDTLVEGPGTTVLNYVTGAVEGEHAWYLTGRGQNRIGVLQK